MLGDKGESHWSKLLSLQTAEIYKKEIINYSPIEVKGYFADSEFLAANNFSFENNFHSCQSQRPNISEIPLFNRKRVGQIELKIRKSNVVLERIFAEEIATHSLAGVYFVWAMS